MDEVKKIIPHLCENNASVLLYGEKGTGKSYIASSVHQKKGGNAQNFFEINCKSFSTLKNAEVLDGAKVWFLGGQNNYATLFINCVNKMSLDLQQPVDAF